MASNTTFGAVLREARERRGMDVQSVARQMRVRADIIRAIENNDFTRIPPRGYAKNMVATYARIVGVNQTTITRMYLEAANGYFQTRLEPCAEHEVTALIARLELATGRRFAAKVIGAPHVRRPARCARSGTRQRPRPHVAQAALAGKPAVYQSLRGAAERNATAPEASSAHRHRRHRRDHNHHLRVRVRRQRIQTRSGNADRTHHGLVRYVEQAGARRLREHLELRLPDPAVLRRAHEGHLHLQGRIGFERLHRDLRGRFELGIRRRDGNGAGREVFRRHD